MGAIDRIDARSVVLVLPKFDRRSIIVYLLLAITALIDLILWAKLGMHFTPAPSAFIRYLGALGIFIATMLRRAGRERTSAALEMLVLATLQAIVAVRLQYPIVALASGSIDRHLLAADTALGFDWLSFARHFQNPTTIKVLDYAYASMFWQPAALIIVLCSTKRITRAWQFVSASFIAMLVAIVSLTVFPAEGQFVGCGLRSGDIWIKPTYCDFGPIIVALRDSGVRAIDETMRAGLSSFPSFHAASALIFTWAAWPFKWLRLPIVVLNLMLCVAAITIGEHYFVDILAGLAVGVLAIKGTGTCGARLSSQPPRR